MIVYLLSKKTASLDVLRRTAEGLRLTAVSCSSVNALLQSCARGSGCVLVCGADHSASEIRDLIRKLRQHFHPHAVLVAEKEPTAFRAVELLRLPVLDYFHTQIEPLAFQLVIQNARRWSETEGMREVFRVQLREKWERMSDGLKDVLRLLYDGKTNREIAETLSLSLRTVESRRAKLLEEFGLTTFAELIRTAAFFLEQEILPPIFFTESA
ncbi:MAG: response regulator transcription factor [Thermoguttaceae bacterium]|nr:response regulator transcription factor [Planctomycetaceae bacterium]MBQ4144372.1 response regulator transcription factor [Thermoguttaceae bacterium]